MDRTNRIRCICPYCNHIIESNQSGITFHINRCHCNPDRKIHPGNRGKTKGYTAWNKNLSKETNDSLRIRGEKLHDRYERNELIGSFTGRHHTSDTKSKISITQRENIRKNPSSIKSCGRAKKYNYNGTILDGSWELLVAQYLDDNSIEWTRPRNPFTYIFQNKTHLYYPDFYIPKYDIFVEVKGYKRKVDEIKWKSVTDQNKNIIILSITQINQIKNKYFDIIKYIKNNTNSPQ